MQMGACYVYVDGSDLEQVQGFIVNAMNAFIDTWEVSSARVVNDRYPRTSDLGPDDLPDWLGLNFDAQDLSRTKLELLVAFLQELSAKSGREFVLGGTAAGSELPEDFCFVGAESHSNEDVFRHFAL